MDQPFLTRRIYGLETEFGIICNTLGHRRLSADEAARHEGGLDGRRPWEHDYLQTTSERRLLFAAINSNACGYEGSIISGSTACSASSAASM